MGLKSQLGPFKITSQEALPYRLGTSLPRHLKPSNLKGILPQCMAVNFCHMPAYTDRKTWNSWITDDELDPERGRNPFSLEPFPP
jgi:hypothetical protein